MAYSVKPRLKFKVVTMKGEFIISAIEFNVGFFGISFYGRGNKTLHWFKRKDVCAIILECATVKEDIT